MKYISQNCLVLEYFPKKRCKVPECDIGANDREIPFNQPWLEFAIPFSDGKIDSCYRYGLKNGTIEENGECSADMFDASLEITCSEYIHASDEINVQTEVKITPTEYIIDLWAHQTLQTILSILFPKEIFRQFILIFHISLYFYNGLVQYPLFV